MIKIKIARWIVSFQPSCRWNQYGAVPPRMYVIIMKYIEMSRIEMRRHGAHDTPLKIYLLISR